MTNEAIILDEELPGPDSDEPSTCGDCQVAYPTKDGVAIQAPINDTWRGLNMRECMACAEAFLADVVALLRLSTDCPHYDETRDGEGFEMFAVYGLGTCAFVCEPCLDLEPPTFPLD
jgi:hypothetical protein